MQGDVGSNKTLVALLSMLIAHNRFRAADGATESELAQQHFQAR